MSHLGRGAIIARMREGDLSINPLLSADQIGAASVDLRMGNVVLIVRARGTSHVEPRAAKAAALARAQAERDPEPVLAAHDHAFHFDRQQKHERYELPFYSRFLLHPGGLALVPTLEWVVLPPDLMGHVTARSTWAREGLSIATATLIEPGYQGIVTLELANMGEIPISLYPGLLIAQVAVSRVEGDTRRPRPSQFALSFEPRQGELANASEHPFLP